MSDLLTRLRASADMLQAGRLDLRVAADEIERLTADLETARQHTLETRAGHYVSAEQARIAVRMRREECERARHEVESWQREVGGREADIDRLRGLLARCAPLLDDLTDLHDNGLIVLDDDDYAALTALLADIERALAKETP